MKSLTNYAGLTDRGVRRKQNEDNWSADLDLGLFVVSDGMGGHAGGELASTIIVEGLPQVLRPRLEGIKTVSDPNATVSLVMALVDLNERVREASKKKPSLAGMGATVVLAMIRETQALIVHMGDSRAYLLRDNRLRLLTKDHSIVQKLIDAGKVKAEEAINHPLRGQITRCIGMPAMAQPEATLLDLVPGDRLLLCTDGLTRMVSDEEIARLLIDNPIPYTACRVMINEANEAGGVDNITVVLVDWH